MNYEKIADMADAKPGKFFMVAHPHYVDIFCKECREIFTVDARMGSGKWATTVDVAMNTHKCEEPYGGL
jgi:hypothetical protein